jgi:hypothetical protein
LLVSLFLPFLFILQRQAGSLAHGLWSLLASKHE